MKISVHPGRVSLILGVLMLGVSCVSYPTLVQTARERRQQDPNSVVASYNITDCDVLNFSDRLKIVLASKCDRASLARYGSSTTQATLSSLAGAAGIAGWGTAAASGLGLGAGYILALGNIIDAKGHAQAYEQALNAIQSAESTFYFHRLGMGFKKVGTANVVDSSHVVAADGENIPSTTRLTPDGESLYYRVTKVIKVLDDVLANKIPDLQDLKDASGENGGKSPAKDAEAAPRSASAGDDTSGRKRVAFTATTTKVRNSEPSVGTAHRTGRPSVSTGGTITGLPTDPTLSHGNPTPEPLPLTGSGAASATSSPTTPTPVPAADSALVKGQLIGRLHTITDAQAGEILAPFSAAFPESRYPRSRDGLAGAVRDANGADLARLQLLFPSTP